MPDPFEALRLADTPLAPRPEFVAELRQQIFGAIDADRPDKEEPMSVTTTIDRVETYLSVSDARAAIDFYQRAFGATLIGEPIVMPDGSIGHSELAIGNSVIRVAGEHPPEAVRNPASLGDADALVDRARDAGADVLRPVAEAHGTRMGKVRDPFGHNWFVVTRSNAE